MTRKWLSEFRDFALKGNVVDLAVGVIIGVAFGKIVSALVENVLMPPIGLLLGGVDFGNLFVNLSGGGYATLEAAKAAGAATLRYGLFLNTVVNFLVVAFAIFLLVKQVNRLKRPAAATTRDCPYCLSAIPLKASRCGNCTSEVAPA